MTPAIELVEVGQFFRVGFWMKRVQVVSEISFSVPQGAICGFLGANGAGKTTLIHLIVGLRKPSRGRIRVLGEGADTYASKLKVGYLPERPYFHEHLTGEEFLRYFGVLSGMSSARIKEEVPKVLSLVGLSHSQKVQLRKYSKGMLQRIGFAQALIHDPEVLVLDEPMSGLDPLGRKEVRTLILELANRGKTLFFSSHIVSDIEAICSEVVVIQKGRLIGSGKVNEFKSPSLEDFFQGGVENGE